MKIAIDARYLENETTGIGRYSYHLVRNLMEIDAENEYIVLLRSDYGGTFAESGNFCFVRLSYHPISVRSTLALPRLLRRMGVDLFHLHNPVGPLSLPEKTIVTIYDLQAFLDPGFTAHRGPVIGRLYGAYWRAAFRNSVRRADRLVSISEYTREALRENLGVPPGRVEVIHVGGNDGFGEAADTATVEAVKSRYGLPDRYLFYSGSYRTNKNLINTLRAFDMACRRPGLEETEFVLAGRRSRYTPPVEEEIARLGLSKRVRLLGYVPNEDLPLLYRGAGAFCFITRYEGFGLPVLEAMMCGVPVIASTHAALPEVVGEAGLKIDPDDVPAMADAMERVLLDDSLRNRMTKAGRERVGRFSWRTCAEQTLALYRRVGEG